MNPPYSPVVYKNLVAFHVLTVPIFFALTFYGDPYFFVSIIGPVLILVLSCWSIVTIRLQSKNRYFGLLSILSILVDAFVCIYLLRVALGSIFFKGYLESPFLFVAFGFFLVLLSGHTYVLLFSIYPHIRRKFTTSFCLAFILTAIMSCCLAYTDIRSLKPEHWPLLNANECGYQITYSPKLQVYGGRSGNETCGYWDLDDIAEIRIYNTENQNTSFSLKSWVMLVWPSLGEWTDYYKMFYAPGATTSLYEKMQASFFGSDREQWLAEFKENTQPMFDAGQIISVNGYDAFKIPIRDGQYDVFIKDGQSKIVKFECTYKNDEELDFCNTSLASFKFI